MRVVVTGSGGFLGNELLKVLGDCEDVAVIAVTSKSRVEAENRFAPGRLSVISPEDETMPRKIKEADVLVNCAFPRNVDGLDMANGLDYLSRLYTAVAGAGIGGVINVSSQSVYSQRRSSAAHETDRLCLESSYAVAKRASELLLDAACPCIPHVHIRLASLIGPGFNQRLTNKMMARALDGEDLEIRDEGQQFGFMDVRDAALALALVVRSAPSSWRRVYNLGVEGSYSLMDIADTVNKILKKKNLAPCHVRMMPSGDGSPGLCSALSAEAFRNDFGWAPKYELEDSLWSIAEDLLESRALRAGALQDLSSDLG